MKLSEGMSVAEAAGVLLPKATERFFRAGREAFTKGDAATLHEFRIAAKKFRYVLELFQPVYGPRFAARVATLKDLQDYLGSLNDLVTARDLLEDQSGSEAFLAWLDKREAELRKKLERYWQEDMDSSGAEDAWSRYFSSFAARTVKKSA